MIEIFYGLAALTHLRVWGMLQLAFSRGLLGRDRIPFAASVTLAHSHDRTLARLFFEQRMIVIKTMGRTKFRRAPSRPPAAREPQLPSFDRVLSPPRTLLCRSK